MNQTSLFRSLLSWVNKKYIYINPSFQLPGKWRLFEYYSEPGGSLVNVKEEQIKKEDQYLEIGFRREGKLEWVANLPVQFLDGASSYTWRSSRNFIILFQADDSRKKVKLQFAIVKEELKLLKKNQDGRIEFFGFFSKVEET